MKISCAGPRSTINATARPPVLLSLIVLTVCALASLDILAAPGQAKFPEAFTAYANTAVDGGDCVVGNTTHEGMSGRAYVYLKDASTKKPRWVTAIPLGQDLYQNRATHCLSMGGSLFVLVQSDTSRATSLSQTLLNIVELSPADGAILGDQYADVPGVDAAYSSWVEPGQAGFHEDHGKIKVTGQYFLLSDPKNRQSFTTTLPAHPPK